VRASIRLIQISQAAALALLCFNLHAAEPPPRSRELQELIQEAEKAAKRLELARARELWARIYALEPSTMALCQLGVFDLRLDRVEEAAAELSKCVEQMPAPTNDLERRRYEVRHADLAAVRQRVAQLHVLPPPGTARILVDGREVSAGRPVYVSPGQHEVTATGRQGGQVAHALVKVAAGESRDVPLAFEVPPGAAAAKAPVAPTPARRGPNPWIAGSGAAASATLLGAGLVLHLAGNGSDMEAAAKASRLSDGTLIPNSTEYSEFYDEATSANSRANLLHGFGSAALIAGAAFGAATLVYVVFPRGNAEIRMRAAGAEVKVVW
jgi:hypothetical protein